MAKKSQALSTREFSDMTGISISTVTRLVREGKIKGVKKSGKWLIDRDEINAETVRSLSKTMRITGGFRNGRQVLEIRRRSRRKGKKHPSKPADRTYSVAEFSDLTYLTEKGVEEFLTSGDFRAPGTIRVIGAWVMKTFKIPIYAT